MKTNKQNTDIWRNIILIVSNNNVNVLGSNPAMGFRPGPPDSQIESTLIWFRYRQNSINIIIHDGNCGQGKIISFCPHFIFLQPKV